MNLTTIHNEYVVREITSATTDETNPLFNNPAAAPVAAGQKEKREPPIRHLPPPYPTCRHVVFATQARSQRAVQGC